jgi:hypothetical protein
MPNSNGISKCENCLEDYCTSCSEAKHQYMYCSKECEKEAES